MRQGFCKPLSSIVFLLRIDSLSRFDAFVMYLSCTTQTSMTQLSQDLSQCYLWGGEGGVPDFEASLHFDLRNRILFCSSACRSGVPMCLCSAVMDYTSLKAVCQVSCTITSFNMASTLCWFQSSTNNLCANIFFRIIVKYLCQKCFAFLFTCHLFGMSIYLLDLIF